MKFILLLLLCFALTAQARTWKDLAGREFEAELLKVMGNTIILQMPDGTKQPMPLNRLSNGDREFIKAPQVEAKKVAKAAAPIKDRYTEVVIKDLASIPRTGFIQTHWRPVENVVLAFMKKRGVPAVSLAISYDKQIIINRAYGWGDPELSTPLPRDQAMRLASISKPLTMAAIQNLVRAGVLRLQDKVFKVLELEATAPAEMDARWKDITIEHLLEHKGGFDRAMSGDASYDSQRVAGELKLELKDLTPLHLLRYYLTKPLDFDPGAREAYSNFGYTLLARVVEKRSGKSLAAYLNTTVARTANMTTLRLGRTEPADREPGEVWYCLHPEFTQEQAIFPTRMEAMDGSAALACSAADYCRFLEHYSITGTPREPGANYLGQFFGSTYGTTSVCGQRSDGLCYALICNRRGRGEPLWNEELHTALRAAMQEVQPAAE